jgi:hypothetical protein
MKETMKGYNIFIVHEESSCIVCEKIVGNIVTLIIEYVGNKALEYGEGGIV